MSKPMISDHNRLKRLARYLIGRERAVIKFSYQELYRHANVWVDADYAGCPITRKSTSGGVVQLGSHIIKTWSTTQAIIALSSGEAEYYGLVKGASCGLGAISMYKDMGISLDLSLLCDATAACGISARLGLGKIRHMHTHYLWLQERVRNKDLSISKVKGDVNAADIGTKHLDSKVMHTMMGILSYRVVDGRAAVCPDLSNLRPLIKAKCDKRPVL